MRPLAVYDLMAAPITFDFVKFLASARMHFLANVGQPQFDLLILCDRFRNWSFREKEMDLSQRIWRIHNLLVPIISITPDVISFSLSRDRHRELLGNRQAIFPHQYDVDNPRIPYLDDTVNEYYRLTGITPQLFEAPQVAKKYAQQILARHKKPVILSPRQASFESYRDSPLAVTAASAEILCDLGFDVLVIPDQEALGSDPPQLSGTKFLPEASFNLPLRLALHEAAEFSIISASGLLAPVYLAKALPPMLIYNPVVSGSKVAEESILARMGFNIGDKKGLPWTPATQHWLWEENPDVKTLEAAITDLIRSIPNPSPY